MAAKRLILALLVLLPSAASAQIAPFPGGGVTPPIFGLATAVDGGGSFSPQLFGPQSCTVPAYSFAGATTTGFGMASSTPCVVVGGTQRLGVSATAVTLASGVTLDLGNSTSMSQGAANRIDVATGDSIYLVSGGLGVGIANTSAGSIRSSSTITLPGASGVNWVNTGWLYGPTGVTGQWALTNDAISAGIGLNVATDSLVLFRNRAQNAAGGIGFVSMAISGTAPSTPVACTSPTVTWNNGTAVFQIDVGTSCTGVSTLAVTLPTASNGWQCDASNITTAARNVEATAWSTTSVTFTNFVRTTGVAGDWADGADVRIKCIGG